MDLLLRPWQGEWVGAYCRALSGERQGQVWILTRPPWLGDTDGVSRAVCSRGQSVQEGLLEASRPEVLGVCAKTASHGVEGSGRS